MRSRTLAVAFVATSALLGTAVPADAAAHVGPSAVRDAAAPSRVVAVWDMNESPGSRTMTDDSGHGLRGSIGREVGTGVRVGGARGYRFERIDPDTPPTHPQHLVTVRDSAALDPGTRDYAVTVRLRTTYQFGNIIQKGQATVSGGNFKLQIPSGIVQCLFRGSERQVIVTAPRRINDGRWHTVHCARTGSGVTLAVDGSTVARRSGWTGRISNSWPVSIGGKTDCDQIDVGCDYYAGDIDWVQIDAG